MKRNTTISICKGIAIILMVIAHAEAPGWLCKFIFEFHMPLFFITAGYFFSLKYLNDEVTFVKKRVKGLYWPFVKWSVFFLLIHNWMFSIGVLNEQYGNEAGGVTHPYSWHQIQQNLWNIITAMGGYDQFLCGAFWFFRGLFVASILYLIIYMMLDVALSKTTMISKKSIPYLVCIIMLLLCAWKTYEGLKIITLVQGGYRDLMGCFFFGCGFIFRQFADRYQGNDPIVKRLRFQQLLGAVFLLLTALLMFADPIHTRLLSDTTMGGSIRSFLLALTRRNNWIVTLSIGAVFELYSSFRMDSIAKSKVK